MLKLCEVLTRRKTHGLEDEPTELRRVLKLTDLVALGLGSTLGLGVYVLAGQVAYNVAGPAVIISFLIAGIASFVSAICYAEFAARVPRSGSAYIYSYVTVGEFAAFTIGWNMVLEYVIAIASLGRGLSTHFDEIIEMKISKAMTAALPLNVTNMAKYPDFLSFGVILILTIILAFGVKESSVFNIICTSLNLMTILVVIVAGTFHADVRNWNIPREEVPAGFGTGGFIPFGVAGIMSGAAKCFFGFVGFDGIATTAEEAINPRRNIPLSMLLSLLIVLVAYFGISIVLTLMVAYYEQNPVAPFPAAFEKVGWISIKWIVSIGGVFALLTALLGAMLPLPRIFYAIAYDGLIFESLANIHPRTQTPVIATLVAGLLGAIMALCFDLDQLIDMMSIGTLVSYTMVAMCVLILRYEDKSLAEEFELARASEREVEREKETERERARARSRDGENENESANANSNAKRNVETRRFLRQILCNQNGYKRPNKLTSNISKIATIIFFFTCLVWCSAVKFFELTSAIGITATIVSVFITILTLIIIKTQPISELKLTFKTPWVPIIPAVCMLINLYLTFQLDGMTWIRFSVWMTIGYAIYFFYGTTHSKQRAFQ